jgi:hypothetical protein
MCCCQGTPVTICKKGLGIVVHPRYRFTGESVTVLPCHLGRLKSRHQIGASDGEAYGEREALATGSAGSTAFPG